MTTIIGRCTLTTDPYDFNVSGRTLSFSIEILETTLYGIKARMQQLAGHVDNPDEPVIPFTTTLDSNFDGFYRVRSISVPATEAMYVTFYSIDVRVTLERVGGYSNPQFEVTTKSALITNAHAYTVPPAVVATALGSAPSEEVDLRPSLTGVTAITRNTNDGGSGVPLTAYTLATPVARTHYRTSQRPAYFYYGAARVEVLDAATTTWYTVVGIDVPRNSVWRISNGLVRLTSANGATAGKIEVWDNAGAAWDSQSVRHVSNGFLDVGIGCGDATNQSPMSILRNSPEEVKVKTGSSGFDFTYRLQRGAMFATAAWTSTSAVKYGIGFSTTIATGSITSGIKQTTAVAGNKLVFSMPVAVTVDNVNGRLNAANTATSGLMMIGVELNSAAPTSGDASADLVNQFMGAVSWRQQVVRR